MAHSQARAGEDLAELGLAEPGRVRAAHRAAKLDPGSVVAPGVLDAQRGALHVVEELLIGGARPRGVGEAARPPPRSPARNEARS